MFKLILEYLEIISDTLIKLDNKVGFRGILRYVILGLVVIGLFNFKTLIREGIELVTELQDEIHNEKMEKRDQLMAELYPMLSEFRGAIGADRVLYFEYHNTKENLVGIPFKYVDLALSCSRYGVPPVSDQNFHDINVGLITNLYEDIKYGKMIYSGEFEFDRKYQGVGVLFNEAGDGSKCRLFISVPGLKQPLGMVVIEWMSESEERDLEGIKEKSKIFIPRVTGLILSKQ